ncbi:MAG TPA: hypothetical protein VI072_26995, partial [Polyangiaceae bacterium]
AVQRVLQNSGEYKIAWTSTTDPRPSHSAGPDVVLILGSTAGVRLRIRQHRKAGWSKGLAVAAADTRPEIAAACLDAGADDYIRLPLDSKELLSRIHALARRSNPFTVSNGTVKLDSYAYVATIGARRAAFKKTSFRLFAYLVERAGQWTGTKDLQANVLQACCRVGASNVRWHVLEARRALGPMRWCLHSDSRRGYMFDMQPCGLTHCNRE